MAGKFKYELGINEFKSKKHHLWQSLLAEFLGNLILNFFAVGACTQAAENGLFKALAFGLGVFIAITIVGHASGGHINPAVTVGMLVAGKISVVRAILYIAFQCLGATAGTAAIKVLLDPNYHNGLGHTSLAAHVTPLQGMGIEFFLGFVLVLTVFGACDGNKPDSRYTAPLAIGMSVALGHIGTIHYTGASMNPARTVGTAIMTDIWTDHWVYWVGPILGGIAASLLYTLTMDVNDGSEDAADKYRTSADEREMKKLGAGRDYA